MFTHSTVSAYVFQFATIHITYSIPLPLETISGNVLHNSQKSGNSFPQTHFLFVLLLTGGVIFFGMAEPKSIYSYYCPILLMREQQQETLCLNSNYCV